MMRRTSYVDDKQMVWKKMQEDVRKEDKREDLGSVGAFLPK